MNRIELFNDHFQNYKVYGIPTIWVREMNKYHPARLFAVIGLSLLAVIFAVANDWQYSQRQQQARTIATLSRELRGQIWEVQRAREQRAELARLRFMTQIMQAYDRDFYEITISAWRWGRVHGVEPSLIMAVAHRESAFDPQAVSSAGAVGVMQIMPGVWRLDPQQLRDIDFNIQHGARILRHYIDRANGRIGAALFRYWGGNNDRHGYGYPSRVLGSKYFNQGRKKEGK